MVYTKVLRIMGLTVYYNVSSCFTKQAHPTFLFLLHSYNIESTAIAKWKYMQMYRVCSNVVQKSPLTQQNTERLLVLSSGKNTELCNFHWKH